MFFKLSLVLAFSIVAFTAAAPARAFVMNNFPVIEFPTETDEDTPTRGPCLLCPAAPE